MPTRLLVCIVLLLASCLHAQTPHMMVTHTQSGKHPHDPSCLSAKAWARQLDALRQTAWTREAIGAARRAVEQYPADTNVLARAARVFRLAGMLNEAEAAAMSADVARSDAMALVELIIIATASGHEVKAREAERTLHKRLADNPETAAAINNLLSALGASRAADETQSPSHVTTFGTCELHRDENKADAIYVEGRINNRGVLRFYIDTGHGGGMTLPRGSFAKYNLERRGETSSQTVFGTRQRIGSCVASLALGDIAVAQIEADVMQNKMGQTAAATLGLDSFSPHCVTLDMQQMRLEVHKRNSKERATESKCSLSFWRVRSLIIVPVRLAKNQHRAALIDTGSSCTFVSSRLANDAGWKLCDATKEATLHAFGRSQSRTTSVAKNASVSLGEARFDFDAIYVDDDVLKLLSADELGVSIDLIIGMDVLGHMDRITIDYARQSLELIPPQLN